MKIVSFIDPVFCNWCQLTMDGMGMEGLKSDGRTDGVFSSDEGVAWEPWENEGWRLVLWERESHIVVSLNSGWVGDHVTMPRCIAVRPPHWDCAGRWWSCRRRANLRTATVNIKSQSWVKFRSDESSIKFSTDSSLCYKLIVCYI